MSLNLDPINATLQRLTQREPVEPLPDITSGELSSCDPNSELGSILSYYGIPFNPLECESEHEFNDF